MYSRRQFLRFRVAGTATVKVPETNLALQGVIEKLSRGGIGVYTEIEIKMETSVALEFQVSIGAGSSKTSITGIVKNFAIREGKSILGIEFDREINSKNEPEIFKCLSELEVDLIMESRWIE
ncbi:MAG TPA: PilZ domain-containing protein [Nitrospiria bacterium]|nr:PilZ domain-containing protein [Nitrospiria bacterium]